MLKPTAAPLTANPTLSSTNGPQGFAPPNHQTRMHSNINQGLRHALTVSYFTCMPHIKSLVCIVCRIPGLQGHIVHSGLPAHLPTCHMMATSSATPAMQHSPQPTSWHLQLPLTGGASAALKLPAGAAQHCTGSSETLAKTDHSLLVALPNLHAAQPGTCMYEYW